MRLHRVLILLSFAYAGCSVRSSIPKSYETEPVLLHLSKINQHDSIGFNMVSSFHEFIYPLIKNGDIALWKTPKKNILINKNQFAMMEELSETRFITNNDLFIHEYWQLLGKEFTFSIRGFSFIGISKTGKKTSFGYVDVNDITNLLKSTQISTNHKGPSDLSFWNGLNSKKFNFNIVQFGKKDFRTNPEQSVLLKNQACYSKDIKRNIYQPQPTKRVTYKILHPSINSNPENKKIYEEAETSINNNKQIVLNLNQQEIPLHTFIDYWQVKNIIVVEKWSSFKNIPFQELEYIQFEIKGISYQLSNRDLEELEMKINFQGIAEYLSEKNFDFLIQKINDENISPIQSETMYNTLLKTI